MEIKMKKNIDNFGDQEQNNYISQQQINLRK